MTRRFEYALGRAGDATMAAMRVCGLFIVLMIVMYP